ncbi:Monodehydroascorbate reductase chloroplastic/mitochondrial [Bienertia sinuspersici]
MAERGGKTAAIAKKTEEKRTMKLKFNFESPSFLSLINFPDFSVILFADFNLIVVLVRRLMATMSNSLSLKHGFSVYSSSSSSFTLSKLNCNPSFVASRTLHGSRSFSIAASANFANDNREYVIVGGGNAAGYAARTFVEHGLADGKLCMVTKECANCCELVTDELGKRRDEQEQLCPVILGRCCEEARAVVANSAL